MRTSASCAALCLALAAPIAFAEEEHPAIQSFKAFATAVEAKDGGKVSRFIPPRQWPALVKSGKKDELISKMIAAANKEGATFSFMETEGSVHFLNGEITIQPDGVRVPVQKGGDPWTLDVAKLVGQVEVSEKEEEAYLLIARFVLNLNSYKKAVGIYPTTEQGLGALAVKPTTDPIPKRWLRLQREIAKDPWGNEFVYASTKDGITVRSLGPDGKKSDDDIVNPF